VDGQSGVFTVPCRAEPTRPEPGRAAACSLLHSEWGSQVTSRTPAPSRLLRNARLWRHATALPRWRLNSPRYYVTDRCWAVRRLFTGRSVQRLYNDSSIQNKSSAVQLESTVRDSETSEIAGRSEQVNSE
jgi:hypothetical protein